MIAQSMITATSQIMEEPSLVNVIIHGHFYQPPRENPFTNKVPQEHGAEPFHDFNEKITAECYNPNIKLGNLEQISYNFGPTLLAWMEQNTPDIYADLIGAENAVYRKHGCSNAMAQVYNHVITPLASYSDIKMQVAWGLMDYEMRFGHKPDGMWLAETAVSYATLEVLADAGMKFIILAPWQADHTSVETIDPEERAVMQQKLRAFVLRELAPSFEGNQQLSWAAMQALKRTIIPEKFDPTEPYLVELRGGKSIVVFFYNAPLSGGISFDQHATADADNFAHNWLLPQINTDKLGNNERQVITIATDGELYGHHKSFRDYFLQRLTTFSLDAAGMDVTFPALYLKNNPPLRRIRVLGNTSWSCHHGVKRWGEGCDCTPGNTRWKTHLRKAFDVVAEEADRILATEGERLFVNNNQAVQEYINVWLGKESFDRFVSRHFKPILSGVQDQPSHHNYQLAERLLKSQIYKHQMYTSCAWFFEDIERIEPKNALAAAAVCLRLLGRVVRPAVRLAFEAELEQAVSNHHGHVNGLQLYRRVIHQNPKTV